MKFLNKLFMRKVYITALFCLLVYAATAQIDSLASDFELENNARFDCDGLALALKTVDGHKKYGFVDETNHVRIDFLYDKAEQFDAHSAFAKVEKNEKTYLLTTKWRLYPVAYSLDAINNETEVLDLHSNNLTSIPEQILNQKGLKILILFDNKNLTNLIGIDLMNNPLLPKEQEKIKKWLPPNCSVTF